MLRPYQTDLANSIASCWASGARNVLAVLPTGGGKTVLFSSIIQGEPGVSVAMAHRQELVGQMSLALARNGIRHRVVAPPGVRGEIEAMHVAEFGRRFVDPHSNVIAAGVHTLVNHPEPWMERCSLWVCDEAHHLGDKANVWGRAVAMLPAARGLGVTATPTRADGKGLGRHADGVFDQMVVGPGMRELIEQGYLCDYRIFAPRSDLDLSSVAIGASGDYVGGQLRAAVHKSHLTGDTVAHYLRLAPGKLGITFTVDVETAEETAEEYRAKGVRAEVLTGKTPTAWRQRVMRAFRAREIQQICNCDLLGEGTDVPAVEVVSFARPTASYGLYVQQFGRALRILEGKSHAIIIDHAGNVIRHGLPDAYREWSLDRRERGSRGKQVGVIPVTSCGECAAVYERVHPCCPFCGYAPEPASRAAPHYVDGDLTELDAATLAALRGEVSRVDSQWNGGRAPSSVVEGAMLKQHNARQAAQAELRQALALYGGWRTGSGDTLQMAQRRFYLTFGVDVMAAQALGARDAADLAVRVNALVSLRGKVVAMPAAREPESERERVASVARPGMTSAELTIASGVQNPGRCLPPDLTMEQKFNGTKNVFVVARKGETAKEKVRRCARIGMSIKELSEATGVPMRACGKFLPENMESEERRKAGTHIIEKGNSAKERIAKLVKVEMSIEELANLAGVVPSACAQLLPKEFTTERRSAQGKKRFVIKSGR